MGECDGLGIDNVKEEDVSIPGTSSPCNEKNLVEELIGIIQCVNSNIGEYRRTQRKECQSLIRRLQILLPFLEEIKHLEIPIPESAIQPLNDLKHAFHSAKKLLTTCYGGSKIYLSLESEATVTRFRGIYDKITHALEGMPYEELGISDEEKEQVELMSVQLKRAKRRTDTQDMELAMDLMVALSTMNDTNADNACLERLATKLGLQTVEDLQEETLAIRNVVKEMRGQNVESTQQMIDLLNKLKRLAGVPETAIAILEEDPLLPKSLHKCPSLAIPHDFLCPITLEIMTDPVIISTGQTYEKESIQKWLDSDHRTCPKTGQPLTHLSLAPNFALKNLIEQWCEKHKLQLPNKEASENNPKDKESCGVKDDDIISTLVQKLSSNQLDVQRKAVAKIRMLSKESPDNRTLIANSGGIRPLVHLLYYPDSKIQEHAVTGLLNLSIDETNKKMISKEEPIQAIVEILQKGTIVAKENSAATLFSLSMLDENKVKIGASNGIPPLVHLLKKGTIRGKKDALTALFNLSLNHANKTRAIEAGIISALLDAIEDKNLDMSNEILSIFLLFASHQEGRKEIEQLTFVDTLVKFIKDGTPKNKECAIAVLLELGSNGSNGCDLIEAVLKYGVYEHLGEVAENGTDRGKRKAKAMLQLVGSAEQNI